MMRIFITFTASKFDMNLQNITELAAFLQNVDMRNLTTGFPLKISREMLMTFAPTIESENVTSAFIAEAPETILSKQNQKKCDVMFGYTKHVSYNSIINYGSINVREYYYRNHY